MSNTKGAGQLILGTSVYYKKVFHLKQGDYIQVHQEYEPRNTIDIDWTVGTIALVPKYNLQGGYFFESLLTGKCIQRSHWTPVNTTEYVIELHLTLQC